MAWKIEVSDRAQKQLRKLNRWQADQITAAILEIGLLEDPRVRGKPMVGSYAGHWRYRIGDWRAIVQIVDGRMVLVLVAVGHRREVYD